MTHPHLTVETDGPVRTLTLANPGRRNAQTPSLWRALAEQAAAVPDDVRVVVIRGEGPSFSAGIDTAMFTPAGVDGEESMVELASGGPESIQAGIERFQAGFTGWQRCHAVVVAQVHGHAIGAGFQLALAADLRVAATDASFAMRETSLGLVPDLGGTKPLVDLVGYARALELCATGRAVSGQEALAMGLVNAAVPLDELDRATAELVGRLVEAPRDAVRALKPLLRSAVDADHATQTRREREAQTGLLLSMLASFRR
ncbi:enoyl-CoA hydratase [Intrasporangium oryzae NRRL B-24470]|uniref:Enoyl-CoA hydratase n=1 Tax=Intrasporangium oryzae NRRL B-24470 TaxID=1386089 RepID=W9GD58_9MICO|nr:enoyl-CoA hydratase/isomerase family protein [Intrasporangium oryzae]EWT01804.1 enoyl-CoA hydratase [Intrasporangium oryzae NRRL B-24470]